jgi:hypothetical protein
MSSNNGNAPIFDEEKVAALILEWQQTREPEIFAAIVEASLPLIRCVACQYAFVNLHDSTLLEMVNDAVLKIHRLLPFYDPNRGRCFTLFSLALQRFFISRWKKLCNGRERVQILPPVMLEEVSANLCYTPPECSREFKGRLAGLTTRFTAPAELLVQRYVLRTLLETGALPLLKQIQRMFRRLFTEDQLHVLVTYVMIRLRLLFREEYASQPLVDGEAESWRQLVEVIGPEKAKEFSHIFLQRFFLQRQNPNGLTFPRPKVLAKIATLSKFLNDEEAVFKLPPADRRLQLIFEYKWRWLQQDGEEEVLLHPWE